MYLQVQLELMMLVCCNRIIRENLVSSYSKEDEEPEKPDHNEDVEEKQKRRTS
jgi:hypothetical protein